MRIWSSTVPAILLLAATAPVLALDTAVDGVVNMADTRRTVAPNLIAANLFPANGAAGVCPDTPLRLVFPSSVTLGASGLILIREASDHAVVESIDVSRRTRIKTIGGLPGFRYYPVIVTGREAAIYPAPPLAYGKTYDVAIDPGVFSTAGGAPPLPVEWRFATRAAPPAAGTTRLTVAADGTGDFCTVQGALDFIPDGNTMPTTIFVRRGRYTEIVYFRRKHALTIEGEDRRHTVIAYANNARFNDGGGNPYAVGGAPARGSGYHRGVFFADQADDLVLANLTIRNTTPHGGSQAEALILGGNRTPVRRAIVDRVDLTSYQDTLQINGQAYIRDCHIEGDVDFMWGTGPCFFEDCECRSLSSGRYYTQIRNPGTHHGYVYLDCTFDGAPGVADNTLSRIEPRRFPHSEVVLLDCVLTGAVGPVGWLLQGPGDPSALHFWEFRSRDPAEHPVDTSRRLAVSRQLRLPADAAVVGTYTDPVAVLGGGWNPRAAPIFARPPP